jgi:hypothetical protein
MKLLPGQKAVLVDRQGRAVGPYNHQLIISVRIDRKDGTTIFWPKNRGYSPYILSSREFIAHWKSGLNKYDTADYAKTRKLFQGFCDDLNNGKSI